MDFTFNMGSWNSVFAVPSQLVDNHLKLAGKEQLQVILWILRNAGSAFSYEQLSNTLGVTPDDAEDAVQYWIDCGLLCRQEKDIIPAPLQPSPSSSQSKPPVKQKTEPLLQNPTDKGASEDTKPFSQKKQKPHPKPDGMYLATRLSESPELQYLMRESENTLGKTLSPALSSAILMFYEDYGLPVEVILMMIHYVCGVGKTGTSYIESLAKDWADNEIFTIEAAEQKLKDLDERQKAWKRLESIIGIYHRSPTKKEAAYAYTWIKEWTIQNELITEAYERCVDKTGKLSLAYMNKILERWHNAGIYTSDDLAAGESGKQEASQKNKSYDLDELESLSFFNPLEE